MVYIPALTDRVVSKSLVPILVPTPEFTSEIPQIYFRNTSKILTFTSEILRIGRKLRDSAEFCSDNVLSQAAVARVVSKTLKSVLASTH